MILPFHRSLSSRTGTLASLLLAISFLLPSTLPARAQATEPAGPAAVKQLPQPPKVRPIDSYIHESWDTLSRSMSECKSLIDPKVNTHPLLYLPSDVPMPPEVTRMQAQCSVRVQRLPHPITRFGQMQLSEISRPWLALSTESLCGSGWAV